MFFVKHSLILCQNYHYVFWNLDSSIFFTYLHYGNYDMFSCSKIWVFIDWGQIFLILFFNLSAISVLTTMLSIKIHKMDESNNIPKISGKIQYYSRKKYKCWYSRYFHIESVKTCLLHFVYNGKKIQFRNEFSGYKFVFLRGVNFDLP